MEKSIQERKQEIVKELKNLYNTMSKISELWGYDGAIDEELRINRLYPFKESFDELTAGVGEWVDDVENSSVS